jgi:NifU-like protein involved in Fe-S cluster formation
MPFSIDNQEMMRQIIVDNYQNPRNYQEVTDPRYITIHMDSASCIDDIYVHVLIEGGLIKIRKGESAEGYHQSLIDISPEMVIEKLEQLLK